MRGAAPSERAAARRHEAVGRHGRVNTWRPRGGKAGLATYGAQGSLARCLSVISGLRGRTDRTGP